MFNLNTVHQCPNVSKFTDIQRLKRPLSEALRKKDTPSKKKKKSNTQPMPSQEDVIAIDTSQNKNVVEEPVFKNKFIGQYDVDISQLLSPPSDFLYREMCLDWVDHLKEKILRCQTGVPTIIPVMVTPSSEVDYDNFVMEDSLSFWTIGGNHITKATKDVLHLYPDLTYLKVRADVFINLTQEEALKLGNQHNSRCKTLEMTFQDKLRRGRKLYLKYDRESIGKRIAQMISDITLKETKEHGVTTITSAVTSSDAEWVLIEGIIKNHETRHGESSSLKTGIFRAMQGGLQNNERLEILRIAVNQGQEIAIKEISRMKKTKVIKQCIVLSLGCESWEDICVLFPRLSTTETIESFMNINIDRKTIPKEIVNLCNAVKRGNDTNTFITVTTTVKVNGIEVNKLVSFVDAIITTHDDTLRAVLCKHKKKLNTEKFHPSIFCCFSV